MIPWKEGPSRLRHNLVCLTNDLRHKFSSKVFLQIQQAINQITGYDSCERLKDLVLQKDHEYSLMKEKTYNSRLSYFQAIDERAKCQRELNTLLQRKHVWTEDDVNRFTELYKNEMRLESSECTLKQAMDSLDKGLDALHLDLMNSMRERYQQEQLWSDKIRKMSTYGTFGLLTFNLALFIAIQLVFEPRKQQRLLAKLTKVIDQKQQESFLNLQRTIESNFKTSKL